jgi:hypothetical protein
MITSLGLVRIRADMQREGGEAGEVRWDIASSFARR